MKKCTYEDCDVWLEESMKYCHGCGKIQLLECEDCEELELVKFIEAGICQQEAVETRDAFFEKQEIEFPWWQRNLFIIIFLGVIIFSALAILGYSVINMIKANYVTSGSAFIFAVFLFVILCVWLNNMLEHRNNKRS